MLFCKKIKKISPYFTSLYVNSQNFSHRFSHKTRRYVQVWRDAFFSKEIFVNDLFCLITIFPFLAQSFLRPQGFLMNISIPFLARNFGSSARLLPLATPESYSCTSRISQRQVTQQLTKIAAKNKTKPFQSQTNPIFWRSKPILSLKMRIFDKFRKHFLCKTNPMVCYRYSNRSGV